MKTKRKKSTSLASEVAELNPDCPDCEIISNAISNENNTIALNNTPGVPATKRYGICNFSQFQFKNQSLQIICHGYEYATIFISAPHMEDHVNEFATKQGSCLIPEHNTRSTRFCIITRVLYDITEGSPRGHQQDGNSTL